jgi:hypothetical protein
MTPAQYNALTSEDFLQNTPESSSSQARRKLAETLAAMPQTSKKSATEVSTAFWDRLRRELDELKVDLADSPSDEETSHEVDDALSTQASQGKNDISKIHLYVSDRLTLAGNDDTEESDVRERAHSPPRESESSGSKQRTSCRNEGTERRPKGSATPPRTQSTYPESSSRERRNSETNSDDEVKRQSNELKAYTLINEMRSQRENEIEQAHRALEEKKAALSEEDYELEKTKLKLRSYKLQSEREEVERLKKLDLDIRKLHEKDAQEERERLRTTQKVRNPVAEWDSHQRWWICCQDRREVDSRLWGEYCPDCSHSRCESCTTL